MLTVILLSSLLIVIIMTAVWLLSVYLKDMSVVDAFWGLGFMAIAHHWFFRLNRPEIIQIIVVIAISLWGLRLALHIFYRNRGKGEDPRYVAFRNNWKQNTWWISYFKVFLLQGALMLIISLPVLSIMALPVTNIGFLQWLGLGIWLFGWLFESAADYQLLRFKNNGANKGQVMNKGVWRYSRHPNYFGETCVWWGIFILSIGSGYWYLSILSPILITFMLLKVSGVTLLEKRYEGNDKYAEYKRKTSAFIPMKPKN